MNQTYYHGWEQIRNDCDNVNGWKCENEAHPSLVFFSAQLGSNGKVRYEPSRIDIFHVIVLRHLGHNAVALRA
jgi:hypothetical protein